MLQAATRGARARRELPDGSAASSSEPTIITNGYASAHAAVIHPLPESALGLSLLGPIPQVRSPQISYLPRSHTISPQISYEMSQISSEISTDLPLFTPSLARARPSMAFRDRC